MAAASPDTILQEQNLNVFGPRAGYTPQMSSLISMFDWMRFTMLRSVEGMGQKELDFLLDENANSIGAMLFHLAATDKLFYLNCFEGVTPQTLFNNEKFSEYRIAMELGDNARQEIKGYDLDFYLEKLETTREETKKALSERDDEWLMAVDNDFPWGPTNNYCKLFHVCEHESNHNGQIKLIRSRIS